MLTDEDINTGELRKCATCVYLAAESSVAEDIAKHLLWAADKIDHLTQTPSTASVRDAAIEECAVVAECWRDGNPNAVAAIDWTARTLSKAIRAMKSPSPPVSGKEG